MSGNQGIAISTFATAADLTSRTNALSAQLTAFNNSLNARIDSVFGSLADLTALVPAINAQFTALNDQLTTVNGQLTAINAHLSSIDNRLGSMDAKVSRAFELIAISAALKDAIPNPGDRFALRLNAGGFNGEAAGGIGVSMNAGNARLSLDYGRSRTENAVSGGVNLSFH